MLTSTLDFLRRQLFRREATDGAPCTTGWPAEQATRGGNLIFRLKAWPQLPESGRTADIYRVLSVMSSQPVNRQWLLARCRMAPQQLDRFLQQLIAEGALEVIDPARFAAREQHGLGA
jgi:hypothetical protein